MRDAPPLDHFNGGDDKIIESSESEFNPFENGSKQRKRNHKAQEKHSSHQAKLKKVCAREQSDEQVSFGRVARQVDREPPTTTIIPDKLTRIPCLASNLNGINHHIQRKVSHTFDGL